MIQRDCSEGERTRSLRGREDKIAQRERGQDDSEEKS